MNWTNRILWITFAAIFAITLGTIGAAANSSEVCPEGGDWSSHQSPPLTQVDGAVEYCVKGGSANSQGCEGYLSRGTFNEAQAAVNGENACGLSHWSYRLGEPTAEPTVIPTDVPTEVPTDVPTEVPTDAPTEEPTEVPEVTPTTVPTDVPRPTPTSETCRVRVIGHLFHLIGPDGQEADFASFSPKPDGGYYIPNVQSQEKCLGWVAVSAPSGIDITIDCDGNLSVTLVECEGGACVAMRRLEDK